MAGKKKNSREKILDAAKEVARDSGFGNISLDAIAARAGVSKGGLLYNFPNKAALMRALVADFIAEFEAELDEHAHGSRGELVSAYVHLFAVKYDETEPAGVGLLAAIAEDPDFLKPIKAFHRRLLDRLKDDAEDYTAMLIVYLVLEGMQSMKLLDTNVLTKDETATVMAALEKLAERAAHGSRRPAA
jgi:AcrR family transcriptional regulator